MRILIIGIGGVGTPLVKLMMTYCYYSKEFYKKFLNDNEQLEFILIDGDYFEEKNRDRQFFQDMGISRNKAEVLTEEMQDLFSNLNIQFISDFVDKNNVNNIIQENDVIFSCVDQNASKKIISDRCKELENFTLISGGNSYHETTVQIHCRRDGKDITPAIDKYHPDLQNPTDKHPNDMSCEELYNSEPQLIFTNNLVSINMAILFYHTFILEKFNISEHWADIETMKAVAHKYKP
jgi:molybdopterin/thiamine biosynthesis adenylyltransferase